MAKWASHHLRESALEKIEARLAQSPDVIDLRFERACLLDEMGRRDEAKQAYLDILSRDAAHLGTLTNLGALLYATDYRAAALTVYREIIKNYPDDAAGHVNIANVLSANGDIPAAKGHYEEALRLAPDLAEAHQGLAGLLMELRDEKAARVHWQRGFQNRPYMTLPYRGEQEPVQVLLLVSASGGNIPLRRHLDDRVFMTSVLVTEFYDPTMPLPPHQFVLNSIGDADLCQPALSAALKVLKQTKAPVINHPAAVMKTGRADNALRLSSIPGIVTPRIIVLSRKDISEPGAMERHGFTFPLLLRAQGFHAGQHFVKVDKPADLPEKLAGLPGSDFAVIQYLDARSTDRKIRKYRVMMIGGKLYPLHAAISTQWKIHYFTADMAENPQHRAEDQAFLEDMSRVLGPGAMTALEKVRDTLGLDYAGIDFSLNAAGDIILFEANATMVVNPPDPGEKWGYRKAHVQRVLDAVKALLTQNKYRKARPI